MDADAYLCIRVLACMSERASHTHAYGCMAMHPFPCVHVRAYARICMHRHTYACLWMHMHTGASVSLRACACIHMNINAFACVRARMYAFALFPIRSCARLRIHICAYVGRVRSAMPNHWASSTCIGHLALGIWHRALALAIVIGHPALEIEPPA